MLHLPYLWAVPDFEKEKSRLYQSCQIPSGSDTGMITENPGFYAGDQCGGRRMGDVTSIWALEVLEIYRHTGNVTRLLEAWPAIVRAANWSILQSEDQGCPAHLVCTCESRRLVQQGTHPTLPTPAPLSRPPFPSSLFTPSFASTQTTSSPWRCST